MSTQRMPRALNTCRYCKSPCRQVTCGQRECLLARRRALMAEKRAAAAPFLYRVRESIIKNQDEPNAPRASYRRDGATILLLRAGTVEHRLPICADEREAERMLRLLTAPWG